MNYTQIIKIKKNKKSIFKNFQQFTRLKTKEEDEGLGEFKTASNLFLGHLLLDL